MTETSVYYPIRAWMKCFTVPRHRLKGETANRMNSSFSFMPLQATVKNELIRRKNYGGWIYLHNYFKNWQMVKQCNHVYFLYDYYYRFMIIQCWGDVGNGAEAQSHSFHLIYLFIFRASLSSRKKAIFYACWFIFRTIFLIKVV